MSEGSRNEKGSGKRGGVVECGSEVLPDARCVGVHTRVHIHQVSVDFVLKGHNHLPQKTQLGMHAASHKHVLPGGCLVLHLVLPTHTHDHAPAKPQIQPSRQRVRTCWM